MIVKGEMVLFSFQSGKLNKGRKSGALEGGRGW